MTNPPRSPNTSTLYQERPKMFAAKPLTFLFHCLLLVAGIALVVLGRWYYGAPAILVGGGGLLIWYVATLANKLMISERSVRLEKGILSKSYVEVRLADIRTVQVQQSLMNRLMDTGLVLVTTMGDRPEIAISGLPRPKEIEQLLQGDTQVAAQ